MKIPNHSLKWRIVFLLATVSIIPLSLVGFGSWFVFGQMIEQKALEIQHRVIHDHAFTIESYLQEKFHLLELISYTNSLDTITNQLNLIQLFRGLNRVNRQGFIDLGVTNSNGKHLAYTGPFDLRNQNYYSEEWFKVVMSKGVYISDVFLGFRKIPHCIISDKS